MSDDSVELSDAAVDDVLDDLETAMHFGEMALSHDEIRPSTDRLAHLARDAYRTLVEAHPDYQLAEDDDE